MPLLDPANHQQVQDELTRLRALGKKRRIASLKLLLDRQKAVRPADSEQQIIDASIHRQHALRPAGGPVARRVRQYIPVLVIAAAVAIIATMDGHAHKPASLVAVVDDD